jgi:signal transduction histidine kinase/HAMP domain-containing protein/ActR/RegA family two-component response regulator
MPRLSIARTIRLALIGLIFTLAVVAAVGVASLYSARQRYEDALQRSSTLATASANLDSAGIAEAEVLRDARGPGAAATRGRAAEAYRAAAAAATTLAGDDPVSRRILSQLLSVEAEARRLASRGAVVTATAAGGPLDRARRLAAKLQARQFTRQAAARSRARSESRRAVALVAAAAVLALLAALALVTGLVRSLQRPLDELVSATRSLAAGELSRRVDPSGPEELRALGASFNTMAQALIEAQGRLEAERRRLQVTIESLGDALLVTHPGSAVIATANPRAAELLPELSVGDRVDTEASPLPPLDSALEQEIVVEHRGRTLAVSAAVLGTVSEGVVWTVHDMTERARLERAKSEFVATASHELRSPLTSIKGFAELLERAPENMSARQREFTGIIHKSTDRLVDLVNDLLDVARIEAGHVEINRRPIDVGEAVREVTELLGPRIAAKHQRLSLHVAPALPLAIADSSRVRQIVANLVTNAHQYTEEGGAIDVRVEGDHASVRIAVRDSGVGMTEAEVAHVFERFFRGPRTNASSPGTGLGLSIVKSLVELHHGEIELESEPGSGSTFRVSLPAAVPLPASEQTQAIVRGRRVLIVDDEQEIAELIQGQLTPMEVRTTIASSGEAALEQLRTGRYDAVTLDILMPGMDGFEVLRQIRADPELRDIPIVFVSVFSGRQELAGEWVVAKPIDADELREVLAAALSAGRSRVLVVGREQLQPVLQPALEELGIEHQWEVTGTGVARVCRERRFEVALVDVGVRNPAAVLQALDLRGRRLRRAVILFTDGGTPPPAGVSKLGMEVVPVSHVGAALLAALRGETEPGHEADEASG